MVSMNKGAFDEAVVWLNKEAGWMAEKCRPLVALWTGRQETEVEIRSEIRKHVATITYNDLWARGPIDDATREWAVEFGCWLVRLRWYESGDESFFQPSILFQVESDGYIRESDHV